MIRRLVFASLLAASPVVAMATDAMDENTADGGPIQREFDRCVDASGAVDSAMVACGFSAEEAWDAQMNATYAKLMQALDADARAKLRQAQRRWVAFRDAEFEAIAAQYRSGGTMDALDISSTRLDLVKRRALDLAGYLSYAT